MMDSGQSPKSNTLPVKTILLILLGAAIAIWFILQRNKPPGLPRVSSGGSIANDMSNATALPTPAASPAPQERVERYPMLDSPDSVTADQEFPIQVSLTEQQQTPDVKIMNGTATPDGKLVLALPPTPDNSWKLDVILSAPGLQFTRGTAISNIDLPRQGDATSAIFYVKAGPGAVGRGVAHVLATFDYKGGYLARIGRDIQITSAAPALPAEAPAMRPTVKTSGSIADNSATFSPGVPQPDLTLIIKGDGVIVLSPHLGGDSGTLKDPKGFPEWLAQHSPSIAGRGSVLVATETNRDRAEGFGEQLYDNYAPDVFKRAFWALVRTQGKNFRTIQIYSDNPDIPWELMRPVREDGTGRQNFLGVDYSIARWHMTDGLMRERPPYSETVPKMFVIAPHYTGNRTLDAEATETQALAQMNGYSAVDGNMQALRALFHNPPQGIVHFAGHGELSASRGDYEILLEDGELDTSTWRGMAQADPSSHTFFFFNACDVGQTKHSGNFVDGWGPAVLEKGASGYIGALFPVNDQIAARFSVLFYQLLQQQMQAGPADVSETLEHTRRDVYQSTGDPTALAYVLYGDTNLKFVR
jgi:CHAT domain-containing protein